jgi:para-aminobenzoate synthetase/4-amino-4-deoxychorismate lyase
MVVIQDGLRWLKFEEPERVVCVREADGVLAGLMEVETAVATQNLYAAGFLSYEAAAAFGLTVHDRQADGPPLLWFGLFTEPEVWESLPPRTEEYKLGDWSPALSQAAYERGFAIIKEQIAAGRTYQVNYTFPLHAPFSGDAWALFLDVAAQQKGYAAYLDTGRHVVCSASPELFFRLDGDVLTSLPMKGTAVRGRTLAEDEANIAWLHQSEKNRAENVMIVDMIRNDMGRVAETGSVQVPSLFDVARYPTVLQMTSTVTAKTGATVAEIMRVMFPCSSITGAPKVRTMQIIHDLEPEPRGVYTGAIGFIAPGRRAQFSVAIRTVTIDREWETAVYHVGSGVVWDSQAGAEYAECLLKAAVVARKRPSFDLLESLRWTPEEGYFLLRRHVARLLRSAVYFGVEVGETAVLETLHFFAQTLSEASKVRLLLAQTGEMRVEAVPLAAGAVREPVRLGLAAAPIDTDNLFLYHKTTQREVYAQAKASCPECDEVVLWNERGEVTEATSANLVVKLDGVLLTPPVSSGLLAGTYREALLANGRIRERILTPADLERCEEIYLINSVRGWLTAVCSTHFSASAY